jgi:hypothetical protein
MEIYHKLWFGLSNLFLILIFEEYLNVSKLYPIVLFKRVVFMFSWIDANSKPTKSYDS